MHACKWKQYRSESHDIFVKDFVDRPITCDKKTPVSSCQHLLSTMGMFKGLWEFMRPYVRWEYLSDCHRVVDGDNLYHHLGGRMWDLHPALGCDYARYAAEVEAYFTDLARCRIKPIVIFDSSIKTGGKLRTIQSRIKGKIERSLQVVSGKGRGGRVAAGAGGRRRRRRRRRRPTRSPRRGGRPYDLKARCVFIWRLLFCFVTKLSLLIPPDRKSGRNLPN